MAPEVIAALIASAVGIISAIVALLVSRSNTQTELRKLRTEMQQTYVGLLLEKRLSVYPDLYQSLSSFIKVIEFGVITKSILQELRAHVDQWDSQYSIFFTGRTADIFHEFRIMLAELAEMSEEDIEKKLGSKSKKSTLRHRVAEIELALKSDLGIYVVEFPDTGKERFSEYEEIEEIVKQKDKI